MTRERAKELLPIITAYSDGKIIEYKSLIHGRWEQCSTPLWDDSYQYRVKPKPREWELVVASETNRSYRPGAIDEKATCDLNERGDRDVDGKAWVIVKVREVIEP